MHVFVKKKTGNNSQILINNLDCFNNYKLDKFKAISRRRIDFHLKILEAIHILCLKPELCKQNQFVYATILFSSLNLNRLLVHFV